MEEQFSKSIQQDLIHIHYEAWNSQQNQQIIQAVVSPECLMDKIAVLVDRIFEGLMEGTQDLLSIICSDSDADDWIGPYSKGKIQFSFETLQFECDQVQKEENEPCEKIKMPKNNRSLIYFCRFLQMLDVVVDGLSKQKYRSKREVYYSHQHIFERQEQVNLLVKRLSFLLQVPRRMLRIVSASKGLCAGAIMLKNDTDQIELDVGYLSSSGKGLNISEFMDEWDEIIVYGKYILVVEKETVYFRLLNEGKQEFLSQCALITGKGYACHSTQSFLKLLTQTNPDKPVYYIGDLDPHGVDILCQYTFGNEGSMYERNNVPWIRWLGLVIEISPQVETKGIPLTPKEKTIVQNMKLRSYFNPPENLSTSVFVQSQLYKMWMNYIEDLYNKDVKYEIEALIPEDGSMTTFCEQTIQKYQDNYHQLLANL